MVKFEAIIPLSNGSRFSQAQLLEQFNKMKTSSNDTSFYTIKQKIGDEETIINLKQNLITEPTRAPLSSDVSTSDSETVLSPASELK